MGFDIHQLNMDHVNMEMEMEMAFVVKIAEMEVIPMLH